MDTSINLLSVIPMRKEPSHRSEMVSQLLFGEYAETFEEEKDFVRVRSLYDGYEGWVQGSQLVKATPTEVRGFTRGWTAAVLVNGLMRQVPLGSPVYDTSGKTVRLGTSDVVFVPGQEGFWSPEGRSLRSDAFESLCSYFMGTPYLWGGKSIFGIDCSGFAQQVFKMFGIQLLRDASLQVTQGREIAGFEASVFGDLAFFSNENGRVIHVGIVLDNHQIIHASGRVRIDRLDEHGILNIETGKRTHQLHAIRRFLTD